MNRFIYLCLLCLFCCTESRTQITCDFNSGGYFNVDFETLNRGQIIDANTYSSQGIHFESLAGSAHPLVAFDTENPVTGAINGGDGDPDLGSINEDCATVGPGIGSAGAPGQVGENCTTLGMILIIEETFTDTNNDGYDDVPDDLGGGAAFRMYFDEPTTIGKIAFLDDIDVTVSIKYADGTPDGTFSYSGPGENAYGEWDININNQAHSITELSFDLVGSGGIVSIETCKSALLPLGLISFDLQSDHQGVELSWATSFEENILYYEVMRSTDIENFEVIAIESSKGNSTDITLYHLLDAGVQSTTTYYRLRIVEIDGSFTFSEIESVVVEDGSVNKIYIYPNPARDWIEIKTVGLGLDELTSGQILNDMGQHVMYLKSNLGEQGIYIDSLKPGRYFLILKSGDVRASLPFLKL